jgi:O-antigen ligase
MAHSNTFPTAPASDAQTRRLALWGIMVADVLLLCLPWSWWAIAAGAFLLLAVLLGLLVATLRGEGDFVLLGWVLIFPLGYHFLIFPQDEALITADRATIALLIASACFIRSEERAPIAPLLSKSAICWGVFLFDVVLMIPSVKAPLSSLHLFLDALVFPALFAWYVLRYFDVRKHLPLLHAFTCVMNTYVAAIAMAEVILQRDLLPVTGGGLYFAGDYMGPGKQILIRPNGPFSSDNSLALVGLISLFLLVFLKKVLAEKMPGWQRFLHRIGIAGALVSTSLPLFRSVFLALFAAILVDAVYEHGRRRMARVGILLAFAFGFLLLRLSLPEVFEERTDPEHIYGRIAENQQALVLFADHPFTGVGLDNFAEAAQNSKYVTDYEGYESVDSPHSNLGAVLAETGVFGFLPFAASQVFLIVAFWRITRIRSDTSTLVWKTFLFVFIGWWVNGLALTVMYASDSNMWYMFVLAFLYKFALRLGPPSLVNES